MTYSNLPDPDVVMLEACMNLVHETIEKALAAKVITTGDASFYYAEEPESHVFAGESFPQDPDEWEAVMYVGTRDIHAKLGYWNRVLGEINDAWKERMA